MLSNFIWDFPRCLLHWLTNSKAKSANREKTKPGGAATLKKDARTLRIERRKQRKSVHNVYLAECHAEGVEGQQAVGEELADADDVLDGLGGLDGADDAGSCAEHPGA